MLLSLYGYLIDIGSRVKERVMLPKHKAERYRENLLVISALKIGDLVELWQVVGIRTDYREPVFNYLIAEVVEVGALTVTLLAFGVRFEVELYSDIYRILKYDERK
jgi:hypothetical protein